MLTAFPPIGTRVKLSINPVNPVSSVNLSTKLKLNGRHGMVCEVICHSFGKVQFQPLAPDDHPKVLLLECDELDLVEEAA